MANVARTANARSYHDTTSIGNVDVVTFSKAYTRLEVINRDTTNDLWVTVDSGPTGNETVVAPAVAGQGSYYIGAGGARVIGDDASSAPASVVRLTSSAAVAYSVTGLATA